MYPRRLRLEWVPSWHQELDVAMMNSMYFDLDESTGKPFGHQVLIAPEENRALFVDAIEHGPPVTGVLVCVDDPPRVAWNRRELACRRVPVAICEVVRRRAA